MASATPEEREHLRAGLDALNRCSSSGRMVSRSIPPSSSSWTPTAISFPGEPKRSMSFLEQIARRMAAASADDCLHDAGAAAQFAGTVEQLMPTWTSHGSSTVSGRTCGTSSPTWDGTSGSARRARTRYRFSRLRGSRELVELAELEQLLSTMSEPGSLAELDQDQISQLLGPDAARSLAALADLTRQLERRASSRGRAASLH